MWILILILILILISGGRKRGNRKQDRRAGSESGITERNQEED